MHSVPFTITQFRQQSSEFPVLMPTNNVTLYAARRRHAGAGSLNRIEIRWSMTEICLFD
jgi:hypothetical protein